VRVSLLTKSSNLEYLTKQAPLADSAASQLRLKMCDLTLLLLVLRGTTLVASL